MFQESVLSLLSTARKSKTGTPTGKASLTGTFLGRHRASFLFTDRNDLKVIKSLSGDIESITLGLIASFTRDSLEIEVEEALVLHFLSSGSGTRKPGLAQEYLFFCIILLASSSSCSVSTYLKDNSHVEELFS